MKKFPIVTILYLIVLLTAYIFHYPNITLQRGDAWYHYIAYSTTHGDIFHLISNGLFIGLVGFAVEKHLFKIRMLILIITTAIIGGLAYTLTSQGEVIGASAVAVGMLTMLTLMSPYQKVKVFGLFPISLNYVFLSIILYDIIGYVTVGVNSSIAHSAHIGGLLSGYLLHEIYDDLERRNIKRLTKEYEDF